MVFNDPVALSSLPMFQQNLNTIETITNVVIRRFWIIPFLLLCIPLASIAQPALSAQEVWPAIDAYYRINPKWRIYGTLAGTKLEESSYSDAAIGVFGDYFTFPLAYAKKLMPGRSDSLPGKFLWFRFGYQYSATPPSSEDPFKESMIVTEFNPRFYLPWSLLLTVKNRFDWRFNEGEFNTRYRPRLMIEKDLRTEYLFFTATAFAEYFANFGNSSVNRLRTQIGVEIRVLKHINYEVYWNHQYANGTEIPSVDAFGMTIKVYLDHQETKEFLKFKKLKKSLKKKDKTPSGT
jgi:hypothetical protein